MNYRKTFKKYFTFSTGEQRGIITLLILIGISLIILATIGRFKKPLENSEEFTRIKNLLMQDSANREGVFSQTNAEDSSSYVLFYFDPNTASEKEWIQLGINRKTISTILNYTSKGGKFKKKTDLLRIYGFNEDDFERLYPYIKINSNNQPVFLAGENEQLNLFQFNPNTVTAGQWKLLGVSEDIALRIQNYLSKGGRFKKPEDILKIYGFKSTDFNRLKNYMVFDSIKTNTASDTQQPILAKVPDQQIEINSATSAQLINFGFDKKNAERIISYRNKLGGYYSTGQLIEIYFADTASIKQLSPFITTDDSKIIKINLNTATFDELKNHPYISDELAKAIIIYRDSTGKFYSINEIVKAKYISEKSLNKLKPYLTL